MSPFARAEWRRMDWRILATLGVLTILSLLFLHSAGYDPDTPRHCLDECRSLEVLSRNLRGDDVPAAFIERIAVIREVAKELDAGDCHAGHVALSRLR